jgi:8-oxo-dGTP diphosphatase
MRMFRSKSVPSPPTTITKNSLRNISAFQISIYANVFLVIYVLYKDLHRTSNRYAVTPSETITTTAAMTAQTTTNCFTQTDYTFHGGHPTSSQKSGSCYCSKVDTYCMCNPSLAIDLVILSGTEHVWLVRRKDTNQLAIVGGFVDIGETVLDAVHRELYEETGIRLNSDSQQQEQPVLFGVYSDPRRDNRRHTASIAFAVHLDGSEQPIAADDVKNVERVLITDIDHINFFSDQKTVVKDYLRLHYDRKTSSTDFVSSKGDFAPNIHRSICIPFNSLQ